MASPTPRPAPLTEVGIAPLPQSGEWLAAAVPAVAPAVAGSYGAGQFPGSTLQVSLRGDAPASR